MKPFKNTAIVYLTGALSGLAFLPDSLPEQELNYYIQIKFGGQAYYYHGDKHDIENKFDTELLGATKFSETHAYMIVNKLRKYCKNNQMEIIAWQSSWTDVPKDPPVINPPPREKPQKKTYQYLFQRDNETVQEYVYRLVSSLISLDWFSQTEISCLTDLEYCKSNFGLQYPFFSKEMIISGPTKRYYVTPYKIGQEYYYLCSQWWKDKFPLYKERLKKYVQKLISNHENGSQPSKPVPPESKPPVPTPSQTNKITIGLRLNHRTFGQGTVTSVNGNNFKVIFDEKTFSMDSFKNFFTIITNDQTTKGEKS